MEAIEKSLSRRHVQQKTEIGCAAAAGCDDDAVTTALSTAVTTAVTTGL